MNDAAVTYRVCPAEPAGHLFRVVCELQATARQTLRLPSWIPGSYLLREFARHVVAIEARDDQGPVAVSKLDKSEWACANRAGPLSVTLTVYGFDLSVRGAYLDQQRAFFNGPCLLPEFSGAMGFLDVVIEPPPAGNGADWQVATAMEPVALDARGFGRYRCNDYDELLDHPVEISAFEQLDFAAAGVPHKFIVAGRHAGDLERLATDVAQICETHIALFQPPAPMGRYVFLALAVGEGYGGLEHRASSSLIFSRSDLPQPGAQGMSRSYRRLLGLISHEYFHTWHVKRIKPAAFTPYRYDRRNQTRLLWVFEGITTYYQDLLVLRSGVLPTAGYLDRLAETLTRVYRVPGRLRQSLAEASFEAWDQLYKPTANSANAAISYYSKGALVALALDLTLRRDTAGRVSLDDVMRALWQRYGATATGVPEDGFEALVAELSGLDLAAFFAANVRGTTDPDLAGLLADFAVSLQLRPRHGPKDEGGTTGLPEPPPVALGVQMSRTSPGVAAVVLAGGPGERAGMAPGDELVALDGLKLTASNIDSRLSCYQPGDRAQLAVFRGDELLELSVTLDLPPADTVELGLDPQAASSALARRQAWLGE